ncbi:hypothetical protein MRX96_031449 [Rhipicephalus microplus]
MASRFATRSPGLAAEARLFDRPTKNTQQSDLSNDQGHHNTVGECGDQSRASHCPSAVLGLSSQGSHMHGEKNPEGCEGHLLQWPRLLTILGSLSLHSSSNITAAVRISWGSTSSAAFGAPRVTA